MSWLLCLCGNHIKDMSLPQAGKAHVITDDDLDGNTDYVRNTINMNTPKRHMYVCCECGRLLIETKPGSQAYIYFVPEADRLEFSSNMGKTDLTTPGLRRTS